MGIIFYIYIALFIFSLLYILRWEEPILRQSNNWITPGLYAIVATAYSFLLFGVWWAISDAWNWLQVHYVVWKALRLVKRIKKKYNLNDDGGNNEEGTDSTVR
jgi:hypothetical protein